MKRASHHATEHEEQMSLVAWAQTVRFRKVPLARHLIMIPNETILSFIAPGGRRYAYWEKLQKLGFRKGASDLLLALPLGVWGGLWIEMKRSPRGYPSPAEVARAVKPHQTDFLEQMRESGYRAEVAYGWEMGARLINEYLDLAADTAAVA